MTSEDLKALAARWVDRVDPRITTDNQLVAAAHQDFVNAVDAVFAEMDSQRTEIERLRGVLRDISSR